MSVKMKHRGDIAHLAALVGHRNPSRSLNANTLTKTWDLRWCLQVQRLVAYTLLREVRPFLHNEKSVVEVDCILRHGPIAIARLPHPFSRCGGIRIRRGVWSWPIAENEGEAGQSLHSG